MRIEGVLAGTRLRFYASVQQPVSHNRPGVVAFELASIDT